jgi:hypothetical protein
MVQGDTITRRIAVDPAFTAAVPEIKALLANPDWRGLNRYVGSFDQEPLTYVQTILSHVRDAKPDPQTDVHADTFHPDRQGLLLPHRRGGGRGAVRLCARIAPADARAAGLGAGNERAGRHRRGQAVGPRLAARFCRGTGAHGLWGTARLRGAANTLVVADTVGFHARGLSVRPSVRVEIWTYGRRNPFLPWSGLDIGSVPGIAERRIPLMWQARDFLQRTGLGSQPWRDVGKLRPQDPPGQRAG